MTVERIGTDQEPTQDNPERWYPRGQVAKLFGVPPRLMTRLIMDARRFHGVGFYTLTRVGERGFMEYSQEAIESIAEASGLVPDYSRIGIEEPAPVNAPQDGFAEDPPEDPPDAGPTEPINIAEAVVRIKAATGKDVSILDFKRVLEQLVTEGILAAGSHLTESRGRVQIYADKLPEIEKAVSSRLGSSTARGAQFLPRDDAMSTEEFARTHEASHALVLRVIREMETKEGRYLKQKGRLTSPEQRALLLRLERRKL